MSTQLNRLSFRIAQNRVVAGLHYPVDSIAGHALGAMLARYLVWLTADLLPGTKKGLPLIGATAFRDVGAIVGDTEEPSFDLFVDDAQQDHVIPPAVPLPKSVPAAPVLRDLWTLARREWSKEY